MTQDAGDDLKPIAELCDGRVFFQADGQKRFLYMEKLRFKAGPRDCVMDALLCLNHDNSNYPTKLYLVENVGCGLNWNENPYILGRNWQTYSWKDVSPNQPIIDILAAHLAPLSRGSPT